MKLPRKLKKKIVDFLLSLPDIHNAESQRAFICRAGLDEKLQDQIPFGKPPAQFVPLLVATLIKYGRLNDEQYALEAVLEAAKHYIGKDRKMHCEILLKRLRIHTQGKERNIYDVYISPALSLSRFLWLFLLVLIGGGIYLICGL